jgi:phosphatidate phosphatase LPIN
MMDSVMQSIETEDADDEENYEDDAEDEDAEASDDDEDRTRVVEDVPAEIISGVGHLSVEEKVEN